MAPPRRIAHVDMDAFYASVEIRDDPSLAGKPVVVGGAADQRGVVAAASYEARKYGVRSAMPMAQAVRLCPALVRLPGDPAKYAEVSRRVFDILDSFSPLVETVSLDEAFLDVTGLESQFGPPRKLGQRIKDAIREAVRLTASVGIAPCKFAAKLASDHGKPDGLVVIEETELVEFLRPLPVERLWGVGAKTAPKLHALGLATIGDLASREPSWLRERIGEFAIELRELALGRDPRPVVPDEPAKSMSSEMTFAHDIHDREKLRAILADQAETVAARLRREGVRGRVVQLKLRDDSFATRTRRRTLSAPTDDGAMLYRVACELLAADPLERPLRLIGVGASGLSEAAAETLSLFDAVHEDAGVSGGRGGKVGEVAEGGGGGAKNPRLNAALDALAKKFGRGKVRRGQSLLADGVDDTGTDLGKRR